MWWGGGGKDTKMGRKDAANDLAVLSGKHKQSDVNSQIVTLVGKGFSQRGKGTLFCQKKGENGRSFWHLNGGGKRGTIIK